MCRRYKMLPRVSCHRLLAVWGSIEPPKAADSSAVGRVWRQRFQVDPVELAELPKFLDPTGIGSSSRSVSKIFATPRCTIWCRTNIDRSSRRCGSSTPTTTGPPDDAAVSESITPHTSWRLSSPASPAHDARAPSGIPRPHDVPTTQRTSQPLDAAAAEGLTRDPALSHARRAADDDAGRIRIRERGLDEPHLLRTPDQRPRQPHGHSVKEQVGPRGLTKSPEPRNPGTEACLGSRNRRNPSNSSSALLSPPTPRRVNIELTCTNCAVAPKGRGK